MNPHPLPVILPNRLGWGIPRYLHTSLNLRIRFLEIIDFVFGEAVQEWLVRHEQPNFERTPSGCPTHLELYPSRHVLGCQNMPRRSPAVARCDILPADDGTSHSLKLSLLQSCVAAQPAKSMRPVVTGAEEVDLHLLRASASTAARLSEHLR